MFIGDAKEESEGPSPMIWQGMLRTLRHATRLIWVPSSLGFSDKSRTRLRLLHKGMLRGSGVERGTAKGGTAPA